VTEHDDPEAGDEDATEAERRYPRTWHAYLVTDQHETTVRIPGRLLDRIRRQSDGTLQQHVERALELYAEKLEADAEAFVPGSQAPAVRLWRAPVVSDPASPDEKRELVQRLRQIRPGR
jgi:hypothetical protein